MAQNIDYVVASPEAIESELGQKLDRLRLSKNINQSTLAKEAGVSRRTISRLENGEGISLDTLIRDIGAVSWLDDQEIGVFQYVPEFVDSGIEVAPLMMPLREAPYEVRASQSEQCA